MSKKGLGRGLGALIPEVEVGDKEKESIVELAIGSIRPNPKQPRKVFDPAKIEELAASIREHGIVQPIVVRAKGDAFEIVAGERRWRAAQAAGLEKVPSLVRDFSEAEVMEIALIENLQREDLNPVEEAEAYRLLMEEFRLTQEQLAQRVGKSRPQIANTLRLLQLGPVAREAVQTGKLSMGHAKVLLAVEDQAQQDHLARRVAEEEISVRDLELAVKQSEKGASGRPMKPALTSDLREVERRLQEMFGTPVRLAVGEQKGKIEITFFGEEGLGRILDVLRYADERSATPPKGIFRV